MTSSCFEPTCACSINAHQHQLLDHSHISIRRLTSKLVYENPWMRVREDQTQLRDGSQGIYGVVEKPDFGLIIPQDDDGGFWLVEQYRYPVSARFAEFPQGSWGVGAHGSPAQLAQAELEQETGLRARSLTHLGHLYQAYGFSTQGFDVWLATGLMRGELKREVSEQDMQTRKVSRQEWEQMLLDGSVKDASSVAAYGLFNTHDRSSR